MTVPDLMFFPADILDRAEAGFEVDLSWWLFPLLAVPTGVAGSVAAVGICRIRSAGAAPPEPPVVPPWGVVTITTVDGSFENTFRWQPLSPDGTSWEHIERHTTMNAPACLI